MVAAAMVGAAVVGAAGSAYAANKSASAQNHAVNSANDLARSQYDQTRADQTPYRTAGYSALDRMSLLLGLSGDPNAQGYGSLNKPFTGADLQTDPGYQFELNQGLKTAQNSAAAKGGLYSGATLKALTQYGNDYAGTKFNEAFNRDQTTKNAEYNRLAGISQTGQVATSQVDSAGQNYATQAGGNLIGAGNARGAADIATGNAFGNAVNQGTAWWMRSRPPSQYGSIPTNSDYGGGGGGYYDENGSDVGFYPG